MHTFMYVNMYKYICQYVYTHTLRNTCSCTQFVNSYELSGNKYNGDREMRIAHATRCIK